MNMLDPFMPPLALANIVEIKLRASRQAPTVTMPAVSDDEIAARLVAMPPGAAHGDDDLMSHPAIPVVATESDEPFPNGTWPDQIDAAMATWGDLEYIDLLNTGGSEQELINLVQASLGCTRERATCQVRAFLEEQTT